VHSSISDNRIPNNVKMEWIKYVTFDDGPIASSQPHLINIYANGIQPNSMDSMQLLSNMPIVASNACIG
jgi:hypothetical protein